ncbi:MAG: TIGR03619 family F420-dependent LLM class oxidoreductase [Gammaproteobacteria bacterium]
MQFGINLLNFGPHALPENFERWAGFLDRGQFHFAMVSDHVAVTPQVQAQYPAPFYDPFLLLGWLASRTHRIRLGTTVIVLPYRHPLHTARLVANLDRLSGGRLILGVGAGWAREEFEALGLPYGRRGAATDDALGALRACLAQPVAAYRGRHLSFTGIHTEPAPVQVPGPPLWIGGASPAAIRRAALHGDGWHPLMFRMPWLRDEGLPALARAAARAGRPPPALCPRIKLEPAARPLPEHDRLPGQGSWAQIRADLERLQALGATHVLFDSYAGPAQPMPDPAREMALFGELADRLLDLPGQALR